LNGGICHYPFRRIFIEAAESTILNAGFLWKLLKGESCFREYLSDGMTNPIAATQSSISILDLKHNP
jgi:hypothetical protein